MKETFRQLFQGGTLTREELVAKLVELRVVAKDELEVVISSRLKQLVNKKIIVHKGEGVYAAWAPPAGKGFFLQEVFAAVAGAIGEELAELPDRPVFYVLLEPSLPDPLVMLKRVGKALAHTPQAWKRVGCQGAEFIGFI